MSLEGSIWKITGMQRDIAVSSFNTEYAYENMNLRLTAIDNSSTLAMMNERGTKQATIVLTANNTTKEVDSLPGIPIGTAVIDKYVVIFTTNNNGTDNIYRIWFDDNQLYGILLYSGDLGFSSNYPLETLSQYENDKIQKVYWTDSINQPRVINITASDTVREKWNKYSFDFVSKINLFNTKVDITKNYNGSGEFAPGVIQYCFTYYNKYMQETNIFYTSPLYYITQYERGGTADEKCANSFTITISNYDTNFDYIRIYSIQRTAFNGDPIVKQVTDIAITSDGRDLIYSDLGINGSDKDPTELLYVGGETVTAETFTAKDNTLFLGNYTLTRNYIDSVVKSAFKGEDFITFDAKDISSTGPRIEDIFGQYTYYFQLDNNSEKVTTLKAREYYRFGIQFQHFTGKWSEPVFIADKQVTETPFISDTIKGTSGEVKYYGTKAVLKLKEIASTALETLAKNGYRRARAVIVYPSIYERECICQGVLNPTIYTVEDRASNTPFAQASYIFRPNAPYTISDLLESQVLADSSSTLSVKAYENPTKLSAESPYGVMNLKSSITKTTTDLGDISIKPIENAGAWAEFRHNRPVEGNSAMNGEVENIFQPFPAPVVEKGEDNARIFIGNNKNSIYIDQSIVTLNSPDFIFTDALENIDLTNTKLRIVGYIPLTGSSSSVEITTKTPQRTDSVDGHVITSIGFYDIPCGTTTNISHLGWKIMLGVPCWFDSCKYTEHKGIFIQLPYVVFPWHRTGSLNNQGTLSGSSDIIQAQLDTQKRCYSRYSALPIYFDKTLNWDNVAKMDIKVWPTNNPTLIRLKDYNLKKSYNYYGNIDKILVRPNAYVDTIFYSDYITANVGNNKVSENCEYKVYTGYPVIKNNVLVSIYGNLLGSKNSMNLGYPVCVATWAYGRSLTGEPLIVTYYDDPSENSKKINPQTAITRDFNNFYTMPGNALENWDIKDHTEESDRCLFNPVSMKYKSTAHAVIVMPVFNNETNDYNYTNTLPQFPSALSTSNYLIREKIVSGYPFWDSDAYYVSTSASTNAVLSNVFDIENPRPAKKESGIATSYPTYGYLWLGEIYRDVDKTSLFGGTSEEAMEHNEWLPCGEPVDFADNSGNLLDITDITIEWTEGDTYLQRFDCLKTYPYTTADTNQITEILSFMCETRCNIDGRTDRNRGQLKNFALSPTNFNLFNEAYNQPNNFFTYRTINQNLLSLDNFETQITWTKTKTLGSLVDIWTNITLASVLDLDGERGKIRALRNVNNNIIAFQDTGISQILFNQQTQITTNEGLPLELANSSKVTGKQYLADNVGCTNKWTIVGTTKGLYFIDDIHKDLCLFGDNLQKVSNLTGFDSFFNKELVGIRKWDPINFNNFTTFYDSINSYSYFTNDKWCLAFNENTNKFESFYSYEHIPYLAMLEDHGIFLKTDGNNTYPWLYREGEYNMFFGEYKPFYTTIIANENPLADKVFTNFEFRSDSWSADNLLLDTTFDTLDAWNEYQIGHKDLVFNRNTPSPLHKKFRVWRADVPRVNYGDFSIMLKKHNVTVAELPQVVDFTKLSDIPNFKRSRDRLRNAWSYFKLSMTKENTNKTLLHNMIVKYLR